MLIEDIEKMQGKGYIYILDHNPQIRTLIENRSYRIDDSDEHYDWSLKCEKSKRNRSASTPTVPIMHSEPKTPPPPNPPLPPPPVIKMEKLSLPTKTKGRKRSPRSLLSPRKSPRKVRGIVNLFNSTSSSVPETTPIIPASETPPCLELSAIDEKDCDESISPKSITFCEEPKILNETELKKSK